MSLVKALDRVLVCLDVLSKHLQGQHDQSTHGRGGHALVQEFLQDKPDYSKMDGGQLLGEMQKLIKLDQDRLAADQVLRKKLEGEFAEVYGRYKQAAKPADEELSKKLCLEYFQAIREKRPAEEVEALRLKREEADKPNNPGLVKELEPLKNLASQRLQEFNEQSREAVKTLSQHAVDMLKLSASDQCKVNYEVHGKETPAVQIAIKQFQELVSKDVIGTQNLYIDNRGKSGRADYESGSGVVNLRGGKRGTVLHEMGHWIEDVAPNAGSQALKFLRKRTAGQPSKSLGKGYEKDEVYAERNDGGKWINNYMGKRYSFKSTEITSMGFEMYATKPHELARKDPEMFVLIANIVRGKAG